MKSGVQENNNNKNNNFLNKLINNKNKMYK